ncbi:hypothetical protein U1Q18_037828 [Sarracenia purpurea var. burkii]
MNRKFRKRNFTNQVGVSVNLDSDGNLPPLAGTKETVNTASRLSKLARAMISTATVLEEEVIQVKKENAPFGSPRMTALVDRIKRLKGISPMRINEFATELNWSTAITQATPAETKGSPELVVEGGGFSSAFGSVRPVLLALELLSFGPPYSCFSVSSRDFFAAMLLFLFMLVLSGCWSVVAFIGFRSSFSCLLSLRGCFCSSAAFSGLFSLVLFGGFRLSSGFAVPFVLFCCSGFAASSWILLRCIYWLSNSFLCCCFWVSNMCFYFIQGVQFLFISFGGVLLMSCRRCCVFFASGCFEAFGLLWSLENSSACFSSWFSHIGAFGC